MHQYEGIWFVSGYSNLDDESNYKFPTPRYYREIEINDAPENIQQWANEILANPTGNLESLKPEDRSNEYLYLMIAAPNNKSIEIKRIRNDAGGFLIEYTLQSAPAKTEPKKYILFEADPQIIDIMVRIKQDDHQDIRIFY